MINVRSLDRLLVSSRGYSQDRGIFIARDLKVFMAMRTDFGFLGSK